jgi:hypothetical protein
LTANDFGPKIKVPYTDAEEGRFVASTISNKEQNQMNNGDFALPMRNPSYGRCAEKATFRIEFMAVCPLSEERN